MFQEVVLNCLFFIFNINFSNHTLIFREYYMGVKRNTYLSNKHTERWKNK